MATCAWAAQLHAPRSTSSAPICMKICCRIRIRNLHAATTESQLQKTIVFRTQPQQWGTLTQRFQCDLQTRGCNTQKKYAQRLHKLQLQNRISTPKRKSHDLQALFKRNLKRNIINAKMEKICCQSTIRNLHAVTTVRFMNLSCRRQKYFAHSCSSEEPWRNHSTAICTDSIAKHKGTAPAKKRKSHLEPSVTLRAQIEPDSAGKATTPTPVAHASQLFCNETSVYPKKHNVSCKS